MMNGYICTNCSTSSKEHQQNKQIQFKVPQLSLGFLYQLSLKITYPFHSIALLTDFALKRQATNLSLKIPKIKEKSREGEIENFYQYSPVVIEFDGLPLSHEEFQSMGDNFSSNKEFCKSIFELKIATFGLGKTILFINCNETEKMVHLFSVDDRVCPHYSKNSFGYSYTKNIEDGSYYSSNCQYNEERVRQALKIFHSNPQKITHCEKNKFKIMILEQKIFVTTSKILYLLLSQSYYENHTANINIYHNFMKVQFLDRAHYALERHAQITFQNFYSLLYREPKLKVRITEIQHPLEMPSYEKCLEKWEEEGLVKRIPSKEIENVKEMKLYEVGEKYFPHNNGILLYYEGRLINRFETDLGKMFEEKFYKKKYKENPSHIWYILGIIQLNIEPNLDKSNFGNKFKFRQFYKALTTAFGSYFLKKNAVLFDENMNEENEGSLKDEKQERKEQEAKEKEEIEQPKPKKKILTEKEIEENNNDSK